MSDQTAFEEWWGAGFMTQQMRSPDEWAHMGWHAALAYLHSQGEPVGEMCQDADGCWSIDWKRSICHGEKLYLATVAKAEGWQFVPKEPTSEMMRATWGVPDREGYRRMLAAAPEYKEE
jgi:hypothetical protein